MIDFLGPPSTSICMQKEISHEGICCWRHWRHREAAGTAAGRKRLRGRRDDPLPPRNQQKSLEAIRYLEHAVGTVHGIEGVALRYGNLYGPGTGFAADGEIVAMVRKRGFPIVGDGAGVWSFIHVDDAASAAVAAT